MVLYGLSIQPRPDSQTVSGPDRNVCLFQPKARRIPVNKDDFVWVAFYTEFAEKLLPYANNRIDLIEKIKAVYAAIDKPLPKLEKDYQLVDIDPFTIFGLFKRGSPTTTAPPS